MTASNQQVSVTFTGNAQGLQDAVAQVTRALQNVKQDAKDMATTTVAQGALMADAFKAIASKATEFAKDALGAFRDVASETRKMTRIIGGTPEEMSKLRFAAGEVGVSVDALTRSFGLAAGHFAKNDDAVKKLGISMTDASGAVRPYTDVLGEIGDRLNAMTNPYEKASAARALFGRGYQEMLPLLGLGSDKLKEFTGEAEELGLVMSGKDLTANKNYNLAMKHLKATIEGVWVSLGRQLMPVMQWFVDTVQNAVNWVRHFLTENQAVANVLVTVAEVIGAVGAAAIIVIGVMKVWTVVQGILNAVMDANPIALIVIAVVGLIAAFVALVQNFEPVGNAIVDIGTLIGLAIGTGINIATKAIKAIIDGFAKLMDAGLAVVGFFAKMADAAAGWFGFDTGLEAKVNAVRDGVKKVVNIVDTGLTDFGNAAQEKGARIGHDIAVGIVEGIKSLKIPTIAMPDAKKEPDALPPLPDEEPAAAKGGGGGGKKKGGGGGKSALQQRKDAILKFFTDLINSSREALNAIREAAQNAKDEMRQIGEDVARSFSDAFSITDLTTKSFAQYLGGDALLSMYRKRLADMGGFVANVKKLISLGLPKEMLSDIVGAGVEGGAKTAAMLVANPSILGELKNLQNEINAQTAAAGEAVGSYMKKDEIESLTAQAQKAQKEFLGYVAAGKKVGYVVTDADREAGNANITVNINATTQASPEMIAQAVAWALSTGTALGMKPAA